MELWEVLVPTVDNRGSTFSMNHHRSWDDKVRVITGGLTILAPAKGGWIAYDGTVFLEKMIPVRVAATAAQAEQIADLVASHYAQLAVFYHKVSDQVHIKHYKQE